jgi:hypothetical protein
MTGFQKTLFEDPASPAAPDIPVRQVDTASRRAVISSRTGGEVKRELAEWVQPHDVRELHVFHRPPFQFTFRGYLAVVDVDVRSGPLSTLQRQLSATQQKILSGGIS